MWTEKACGQYGSVTLKADGTLVAGGFPFHHTATLSNVRMDGATINKKAGDEEPITIEQGGERHSCKFVGGRWFYRYEKRGLLARLFGG